LTVTANLVSFSPVDHAAKYRLQISDINDNPIAEYNVNQGFNLLLVLSAGTYLIRIKATGAGFADSPYSEPITATIVDPNYISHLEGETLNDSAHIRWLGRTWFDSSTQTRKFFYTASGFEVAFQGTELRATLTASHYSDSGKQPYLIILVEGEEDPTKGTTLILNQSSAEYLLVSGLPAGNHTVKVLKRSEAIDSNTALLDLSTDGTFLSAPGPKEFRVQFIAASSSTGYGNLGTLATPKTTANSNGMLGFAYLTTYLLDADIEIVSASGWGVTRGWNTGGAISLTQTMPGAYDYFGIDASNQVLTAPGMWDHSDFPPNVIVVNLGTNDFNSSGYASMTPENKAALANSYRDGYTAFLVKLHNIHPQAQIIVAYGLMGDALTVGPSTLEAVANAESQIGTGIISVFVMEAAGTLGNPYGANYHPNVRTSMNNAIQLAQLIHELTGRQVVREMISWNK
jgi:hypothetical protein